MSKTEPKSAVRKLLCMMQAAMRHEHPIRYICLKLIMKSGLNRFMFIARDGYRLHFFTSNVSASMWLYGKSFYSQDESLLKGLLKPGDTFVDVGANIGNLSIVGKKAVEFGTVVAIEAHPKTASFAEKNFALNNLHIKLIKCGVSDKQEVLMFSDMFADDCNSILTNGVAGIEIPVAPMDQLLSALERIKLLKIDVEGYELIAFRGASDTLKRTDYVYFEVWEQLTSRFGYSASDLIAFLRQANFNIYRVWNLAQDNSSQGSIGHSKLQNLLAISDRVSQQTSFEKVLVE